MRDIFVTLLILGTIPFILARPWIGVLVFVWLSLFSPHRYTWGFAYDFPFVMIIAIATVVGMILHGKEVRLPVNGITLLLIALPLWMTVSLVFAFEPVGAYLRWKEVVKAFFFILVSASLLHTRKQIEALLWVVVVSVGYYGIKGGLFTIASGGALRVYGPPGDSYISDNNAIAIALVMVIPLMRYLATVVERRWVRHGLYGAMILSGMAILGSQSRGAFLAVLAMVGFLWMKTHNKLASGLFFVIAVPLAIGFMPDNWVGRMETIQTYEQDASAMGRINAWSMAFNLANDRPLVGGGFEMYIPQVFQRYAPDPADIHSAHSIYFQMLGEHGYVGLLLFLVLGIAAWRTARKTVAASRLDPQRAWAGHLAAALKVSLVGFAVGGLFVNIAYWELQYYEIVILMAACRIVSRVELVPQVRGLRSPRAMASGVVEGSIAADRAPAPLGRR